MEHAVPILPSRDLGETLAFYERLGFENRGAPPEQWDYLIVGRGGIGLHFFLHRDVDPLTTSAMCYVYVDDADALYAEWDAIGVPTDRSNGSRLMAPASTDYGMREFALVDPSGNLLRIGSQSMFDTKIAVVLLDDLAVWQKANATAFLVSGIATAEDDLVGEPYADASGNRYLPMLRQPVLVYAAPDAAAVRRAYERAMGRGVEQLAVFTRELFSTPHDEANRAAVAAVAAGDLDLVAIALRADRKTVDKVVDRLRPHG